ncbi:sensor histidine kinase [Heliomarina baculiformis]|uniref:sensor histidine kinase n=1 Tax=Heliomarina baculiformis TaxID=2872036 RepID=UPI001EE1843D|nr:ATP-binding protein [Heliomarina baculiformis]
MSVRRPSLLRSMPLRLAFGLVLVFAAVSLLSLGASYVFTQRSMEQAMRADLTQDLAGFRAAPSANALARLVQAEAAETDPERMILSYVSPTRRRFGNAAIKRDSEGYHVVSFDENSPQLHGQYLALTTRLYGGQLTVARSRSEITALRGVFFNILVLSLLPTILIALSGGYYLARRGARHVQQVGNTLDQLTSGNLAARVRPGEGWTDDLAEIGAKIDQMARAQESSVNSLRQVSSDIAHDLKTPIQRVAVHLDDLSRDPHLDGESRALVDAANEELERIVSIFHALLQIAQIESGSPKSQFSRLDMGALVETCVELYEPMVSDSGHKLTVECEPNVAPVLGERNLLLQLMANLIENAIRHTPAGSEISVRLRQEASEVVLDVADTGPGIPEAEAEKVVQRLYRLDRSRNTPGSGLGLSFVSVVAQLHEASMQLSDNAPGLCVSIRFPAQVAAES